MIKLYAIHDKQSNTTQHPFPMATNRDAIDGLRQLANDDKTLIGKHPDDFILYYLGEYDERQMQFNIEDDPELIIGANELLQ